MSTEITIGPNDVRRVYEQTALDDHDVLLDPGTYPLRFTTVDFRPCDPSAAYWIMASIPSTRVHAGIRMGQAGDRKVYHLQTQAYLLAKRHETTGTAHDSTIAPTSNESS